MDIATGVQKARRFVASLSVVTLLAGFSVANVAQAATFQDVPADAWFYTYVEQLASAGILDTTQQNYRPADNANRAEAAKMLVEAAGLTIDTSAGPSFKDVAPGAWYYQYVETAAKNGIVSGYTDAAGNLTGMFGPGDAVTREQFSKMAVNAFAMKTNTTGGPHFPDVGTDRWSYNFVETLYNNSVVDGYPDGTFRPTNNINRAEIAKMVVGSQAPVPRGTTTSGAFNVQTATAASATSVTVMFSQNVDATSGAVATNYSIKDATGNVLAVSAATVSADQVTLTTSTQTANTPYMLTVTGVTSATAKALDTGTATFNGYNPLGVGGALTVALDANTPKAMSVPRGASGVVFTCWDFTAGSAATVVQSLDVHRVGAGNQTDFSNVYLYQDSNRLTTGRVINSSTQIVSFSNINVNIAAGGMAKICLVGDFSTAAQAAAQHAFELQAATAITTNASSVSGTFPLTGNSMTVAGGQAGTASVSANGSLSQITIGQSQATIAQFQIQADGQEDESLQRIALTIRGSILPTDVTNFNLYASQNATTPLATTAAVGLNNLVTFTLATPTVIQKGQSKIFYVNADVKGRDGDDIKVYLDQPTDALLVGNTFGFGDQINDLTTATFVGYDGAASKGAGPGFNDTTIKGSAFTVAFNGPAAGNIAVGQNNAHCMDMTISNNSGGQVDIRNWSVTVNDTLGKLYAGAIGTQPNFSLITLAQINADGSVGGSLLGPVELPTTGGTASSQTFPISGDYTLNGGQSVKAAIIFNVAATASNGDNVSCVLNNLTGGDFVRDANGDTLTSTSITPSTNITGNQMTVNSAGLTFNVSGSPSSQTYVAGTNNAQLLGLSVQSGTSLSNTLKQIVLQGYVDDRAGTVADVMGTTSANNSTLGPVNLKDIVDSVALYNGSTMVSQLENVNSTNGTVNFNSLNIVIPANQVMNLSVVGHINGAAPYATSGNLVKFSLAGTAGGQPGSGSVIAIDSNGQNVPLAAMTDNAVNGATTANPATSIIMTITGGGTGTTSTIASASPTIVTGNTTTQVQLASWTFSSSNDSPMLNDLQIGSLDNTGSSIQTLYLYKDAACTQAVGSLSGYSSSGQGGIFTITGLGLTIPNGSTATLCAKGTVAPVGNGTSNPQPNAQVGVALLNVTKVSSSNGINAAQKYIATDTLTTTTAAIVPANVTTIPLLAAVAAAVPGNVLMLDQEAMLITGGTTTNPVVVRGFLNTVAVQHGTATTPATEAYIMSPANPGIAQLNTGAVASAYTLGVGTPAVGSTFTQTGGTSPKVGDVISWPTSATTVDYTVVTQVVGAASPWTVTVNEGLFGSTASTPVGKALTTDLLHGQLNVLERSRPSLCLAGAPGCSWTTPLASATLPGGTRTPILDFNLAANGQSNVNFNTGSGNQIGVFVKGSEAKGLPFNCVLTDGSTDFDTQAVTAAQLAAGYAIPFAFGTHSLNLTGTPSQSDNLMVVCDTSVFTNNGVPGSGDNISASLKSAPTTVEWGDNFITNIVNLGALVIPSSLTPSATFTNPS